MAIPEPDEGPTDEGVSIEQIVAEVGIAILDGLILLTVKAGEVNLTVPMDAEMARNFASGMLLAAITLQEQTQAPKELDS